MLSAIDTPLSSDVAATIARSWTMLSLRDASNAYSTCCSLLPPAEGPLLGIAMAGSEMVNAVRGGLTEGFEVFD